MNETQGVLQGKPYILALVPPSLGWHSALFIFIMARSDNMDSVARTNNPLFDSPSFRSSIAQTIMETKLRPRHCTVADQIMMWLLIMQSKRKRFHRAYYGSFLCWSFVKLFSHQLLPCSRSPSVRHLQVSIHTIVHTKRTERKLQQNLVTCICLEQFGTRKKLRPAMTI